MLNLYYHVFQGEKPLCFTQLGYLSPEGYDPLPANMPWAQNITATDQATWLAEAVRMASQSDRVQLLIILAVDINYDDDMFDGYDIIRPSGDCPVCYTLGALDLN